MTDLLVPSAVADGSSQTSRTLVWQIDPVVSKGDASARHWFWGQRAVPLSVSSGRLLRSVDGFVELELTMRLAARDGAVLEVDFRATEFKPGDYGRFLMAGRISIEGVAEGAELLLHDLGRGPNAGAPERWFATISGQLPFSAGGRRIWNPLTSGPHLHVYAHTEWIAAR